MFIRPATRAHIEEVRNIHLHAFSEDERQLVSILAVNLLSEQTNPPTISLVAETDAVLVGHIAFSPVSIQQENSWQGYILAPLGVLPEYQASGVGKSLIDHGIQQLSGMGANTLFVYGDPKYYGRFGFRADIASKFVPPYELQYPFGWQAIELHEGNLEKVSRNISCVASLRDPQLW